MQPFTQLARQRSARQHLAPEVHWDPVQKNYAILWSSATAGVESDGGHNLGRAGEGPDSEGHAGPRHHRTFISRTTDLKSFTDAKVFFSPGTATSTQCMAFDDGGLRTRPTIVGCSCGQRRAD